MNKTTTSFKGLLHCQICGLVYIRTGAERIDKPMCVGKRCIENPAAFLKPIPDTPSQPPKSQHELCAEAIQSFQLYKQRQGTLPSVDNLIGILNEFGAFPEQNNESLLEAKAHIWNLIKEIEAKENKLSFASTEYVNARNFYHNQSEGGEK